MFSSSSNDFREAREMSSDSGSSRLSLRRDDVSLDVWVYVGRAGIKAEFEEGVARETTPIVVGRDVKGDNGDSTKDAPATQSSSVGDSRRGCAEIGVEALRICSFGKEFFRDDRNSREEDCRWAGYRGGGSGASAHAYRGS